MSAPYVSADSPGAGCPLVKMPPTYDCSKKFRFTRPTKNCSSSAIVAPLAVSSSPRPDPQDAHLGSSHGAHQLDAGIERYFLSADQPDLPAEERIDIRAGAGNAAGRFGTRARKAEDTGPLEEERALLRKQQRKARQIDLTRVHFGFAEVGIEGCREPQARRDAVEEIETGLAGEVIFPSRESLSHRPARNGRRSSPMPCVRPVRFVISPASDT